MIHGAVGSSKGTLKEALTVFRPKAFVIFSIIGREMLAVRGGKLKRSLGVQEGVLSETGMVISFLGPLKRRSSIIIVNKQKELKSVFY